VESTAEVETAVTTLVVAHGRWWNLGVVVRGTRRSRRVGEDLERRVCIAHVLLEASEGIVYGWMHCL